MEKTEPKFDIPESLRREKMDSGKEIAEHIKKASEHLGENPKDRLAAKKIPMWLIPKVALIPIARVMELGAKKYGHYNWRENKVREQVYIDAARRHLDLAEHGEDLDDETLQSHYASVAASMLILLDARITGSLVDDRLKSEEIIAAFKAA